MLGTLAARLAVSCLLIPIAASGLSPSVVENDPLTTYERECPDRYKYTLCFNSGQCLYWKVAGQEIFACDCGMGFTGPRCETPYPLRFQKSTSLNDTGLENVIIGVSVAIIATLLLLIGIFFYLRSSQNRTYW